MIELPHVAGWESLRDALIKLMPELRSAHFTRVPAPSDVESGCVVLPVHVTTMEVVETLLFRCVAQEDDVVRSVWAGRCHRNDTTYYAVLDA